MMTKGRVEAFSDGVLAVAITLLVLDLHVDTAAGHRTLAHQLRTDWPSYVAYAVSFIVIGVIWVNHHTLFNLVAQVDRPFLFLNLILLLFVTTVPFTTSVLADFVTHHDADARWAVVLYGISNVGMAVGFSTMLHRMINHGLLKNPVPPEVGRAALRRFGMGVIAYPISTGLGLIWPPAILIAMGTLAGYYMFEQTQVLPSSD